jgi:multiple sugar transport system substrate-binding protein
MARSLICYVARYTVVFALGLVLLASLGCQRGQSPSGSSGTQTLRLQAFGDPAELSAYKDLIAAFELTAPDVKVEFIPVGKQKDHMTKLTTGFSGGDPPDLFLINFRRFGQFADKDVLEPLGPRMAERGRLKESDLFEQTTEAFRYNGTLMCVPQNVSSLVVYYNRTLFERAGVPLPKADWKWEDFLAAAKALTKDHDGDNKIDTYGLGFEPTLIRVAPFVWQAGGDIVDNVNRPTRFTLDEPAAREALDFIRSWQGTHKVVPPLGENKSEDHESRFARGGLGMILQSRRYTATLRTVQNLDWDVASLPSHKQTATVLHADAYCLAKSSPLKDAAYRFIEFALNTEGATIIAKSGRTVPALKSVADSPAFLDPSAPPQSARVFLDSIRTMRRPPNIATWNEIESRVDPLIEDWYFSETPPQKSLGSEIEQAVGSLLGTQSQ